MKASSVEIAIRETRMDQLKPPGSSASPDAFICGSMSNQQKGLQRKRALTDAIADRLLLFAGIAPVAAVPSSAVHVLVRLMSGREGADLGVNYDFAREAVASQIPDNFYARKRAYLLLQRHGEAICKRDRPDCEDCPVNLNCIYFAERLDLTGSDEKVD
jgi:endonuclease III-like uncharacterized protein